MTDKNNNLTSSPEQTPPAELPLPENYVEFIDSHPEIAELLDTFYKKADAMKLTIPGDLKHSDTEGFVGMGAEKSVFKVDNLAVKVLHEDLHGMQSFTEQVNSLLQGQGVPGLEQIITANEEQGVIITEIVNGKSVPTISSRELAMSITKEHIYKLRDTLHTMSELGLHYDNIKNVLFDPKNGFGFVDYQDVTPGKGNYSTDPNSPDFNSRYRYAMEQQTLRSFLSRVLGKKEFTVNSFIDQHGERERSFKSTLDRRALKVLVKLKLGSTMNE